ncbi:hypothetical protein B0181_05965 [Moraxella caviae]|uniref:MFS transporter n=1 Tax=Moraxella caviae TaxID=34060 RepID=A0A1T0A2H7_9GAMM|nr:hypothetical protein [Moraxella caviae]OOR89953.1 hypothetical protein B0181_05965 [Moraxella caviae]STZ14339.1 Uncharacterised protein [Moraxella caviae]VEW10344.1 Uncharacterised protein [Moraxella caviae]
MSNSNNAKDGLSSFVAVIFTIALWGVQAFLGFLMPIYAIIKDVQNGKIMWAIADIVLFVPVGTVRGLMYLFS